MDNQYDPQQFPPDAQQSISPVEYGMGDIIKSISYSVYTSKEEFEHILTGEKKITTINDEGIPIVRWVVMNKPIVNKDGKQDIMTFLEPLMSISNTWSDLNDASALEKYKEISETIVQMIAFNMERWDLKYSDMHTLQIMIENFIDLSVIRKIQGKKMFDMLQRTVRESRHVVEQAEKQGRGLFG